MRLIDLSEEGEYDTGEDVLEEVDYCDFTGEECFGDKMFCEECPVLTDEDSDESFKERVERQKGFEM